MECAPRIKSFDSLKGFAILLVIIGHAIQYTTGEENMNSNFLFVFIYSFHMPLFMMISGFFFYKSLERSFLSVIKKKTLYILLPCLAWSLVKILMGGAIMNLLTSFWFLRSVFICSIVSYSIVFIVKNMYIGLLIVVLIVFLFPLENIPGYLYIMLPMFYIGMILGKNYGFVSKKMKQILLIIDIVIFVLCFFIWNREGNESSIDLFNIQSIGRYLSRCLIGISGSLLFILFFDLIQVQNRYLQYLGKNTLAIYVITMLMSDIQSHIFNDYIEEGYLLYIVVFGLTVIELVIALLFIEVLDKNRYTKFILLGKRA